MQDPKQEAEDLVEEFKFLMSEFNRHPDDDPYITDIARKCAMFCLEKQNESLDKAWGYTVAGVEEIDWVKQELTEVQLQLELE